MPSNPPPVPGPPTPPAPAVPPEFPRTACAFAEALLRPALVPAAANNGAPAKPPARVQPVPAAHHWQWTQFRRLYVQHTAVWQELTTVTLGLDAAGKDAGWLVDRRKDDCLHPVLEDADVERKARALPQIRLDMALQQVDRRPIDDQRSFAVARFAAPGAPDSATDVFVNHTTGQVMGALPALADKAPAPPPDDPAALAAAWARVRADLAVRVGPEAVASAKDVVRLTPQSAARDRAGRSLHSYTLWTLLTTCDVSVEERTKEVVAWYCPLFLDDAPASRLSGALARQRATPELRGAAGAQGPSVAFAAPGGRHRVTVSWSHVANGTHIEGDQVTVAINAWDGRVYSVSRKWRTVAPEVFVGPSIPEADAIRAADRAIDRPAGLPPGSIVGKSVIEVSSAPDGQGPGRDVLVWRVGYDGPAPGAFTEVAVHHQTGEVVRITGW